jgi:hypothetical protein
VVGDQSLVAPYDPGQIADAGGLAGFQGKRDGKPGRITECLRACRPTLQLLRGRKLFADPLGLGEIETEQIAGVGVLSQASILQTFVQLCECLYAQAEWRRCGSTT